MVTRSRRNIARNEAPPKAVVARTKAKESGRPTTFYVMLFFLALLIFSGVFEMHRHVKVSKSFFSKFKF